MKWSKIKKALRSSLIILPVSVKAYFKPTPIWVHLLVTRKCNLDCDYCYIKQTGLKDLKTDDHKKIIDQIYSVGARVIIFIGGEPTLRKDLFELIRYAHDKGMITHLATNGKLLNQDYLRKLGEAGIDLIYLSMDSVVEFNESEKDFIRNREILNLLLEGSRRYGYHININIVLTNKNIDTVVPTTKLMNSWGVSISAGFITGNPTANTSRQQDDSLFFRTREEKERLFNVLDEIIELKKRKYNIIDPIQYFMDIKKFVNGQLGQWNCAAGKYGFAVDYDGSALLCCQGQSTKLSVFELSKGCHRQFEADRGEKLQECTKVCLANGFYDAAYFARRPFEPIRRIFL